MEPGDALGPIFRRNDGSEDRYLRRLKWISVAVALVVVIGVWAVLHFDTAAIVR